MVACYSCQGHAAEEVSPFTRHTGSGFREEVNGLGATATAARLSRRAGRPKTRRAEDGVAILRGRVICKYSRSIVKKSRRPRGPAPAPASASAPGGRPVAGKSPPGAVWPVNRALFLTLIPADIGARAINRKVLW